jgi:hypothetical protein
MFVNSSEIGLASTPVWYIDGPREAAREAMKGLWKGMNRYECRWRGDEGVQGEALAPFEADRPGVRSNRRRNPRFLFYEIKSL